MKTPAGKVCFAAALVAASAAETVAQGIGRAPSRAAQTVLLPGPSSLSPAKGAPQSTHAITITPAEAQTVGPAPAFYFVPSWRDAQGLRPVLRRGGGLTLGSGQAGSSPDIPEVKHAGERPQAEELRFDAKLPPSQPLKLTNPQAAESEAPMRRTK